RWRHRGRLRRSERRARHRRAMAPRMASGRQSAIANVLQAHRPRAARRENNKKRTSMSTRRNYDIPALRKLDVEHHLPAQADHKLIAEIGGSRIITRAEGCTIFDGEGNGILDGMAGLWCVNVGYGREELATAAYEQMLELPYYNTFFKTA